MGRKQRRPEGEEGEQQEHKSPPPQQEQQQQKHKVPAALPTVISGAVSGAIISACVQPLDVLRTRMQADAALGTTRASLATLRLVLREDGVRGLWRGTGPTVLRLSLGVGVNMLVLERLKAWALEHMPAASSRVQGEGEGAAGAQLGLLAAALVGGGARALSAAAMSPITLVKTRMEVGGPARTTTYTSTAHALASILAAEGPHGLWRGLVPTVLTNAPFSALYYAFYTRLRQDFARAFGVAPVGGSSSTSGGGGGGGGGGGAQQQQGRRQRQQQGDDGALAAAAAAEPASSSSSGGSGGGGSLSSSSSVPGVPQAFVNFSAGVCAATAATLITQPADVIRTRVQLGLGTGVAGSAGGGNALSTLGHVLRSAGPSGLLIGAAPRVAKRTLQTALVWTLYEELLPALSGVWAAALHQLQQQQEKQDEQRRGR